MRGWGEGQDIARVTGPGFSPSPSLEGMALLGRLFPPPAPPEGARPAGPLPLEWPPDAATGTNGHKSGRPDEIGQGGMASKLLAACETNCDTDTLIFAMSFKHRF